VTFHNASTGDYDTCAWAFGDGGTGDGCGEVAHGYTATGAYTVSLAVSGPGGSGVLALADPIRVYEAVEAGFTAVPTTGIRPLTVTFYNASTGDYDTCAWDFGDGGTGDGCGEVAHGYTAAGAYTVSLAVSGPGGSATQRREGCVVVREVPRLYLPLILRGPPGAG
jgi:PKD repeat protein